MFERRKEGELTTIGFGREGRKKVAQVEDFRSLVTKPNKDTFIRLLHQANSIEIPVTQDGLTLQLTQRRSGQHGSRYYYKLDVRGKSFFVKRMPERNREIYGGGAEEVEDSREAKEMLAGVQGVRIVGYKFGFQDNYNSIYISEWNDALQKNLEEYLRILEMQIIERVVKGANYDDLTAKSNSILQRFQEIRSKLSPVFFDIKQSNMAFDEKTGDIIIFDLSRLTPRKEKKIERWTEVE